MPCCFKSSLKSVRIFDFSGHEYQIELVKFLLKNATVLREIKIVWTYSDMEMQVHIENQLQPLLVNKCVITFEDMLGDMLGSCKQAIATFKKTLILKTLGSAAT